MRVCRAFKSNLEDLEERRSIHSHRSLRNMQAYPNDASSLLYKSGLFRAFSREQSSPPGNITIQVPTSPTPHEPLNINSMNARYIDDDDIDDRNDKTRETKI